MKKLLLSLSLICSVLLAYSQQQGCFVDTQYSGGGIYPPAGTFNAPLDLSFSQNITVITPADTTVEVTVANQNLELTADIEHIELTGVTGLPPNFTYACDPVDCIFPGGEENCAEVYSTTNPTISGTYPISFETIARLTNPNFPAPVDCTIVYNDYIITIGSASSVINQFDNQTFDLKSPFPNPVEDHAKIQFISGKSEDIIFRVYNLLGKEVESQIILSTRGVNTIDINTSSYSKGVYLYSINNGTQLVTKRMVVKN